MDPNLKPLNRRSVTAAQVLTRLRRQMASVEGIIQGMQVHQDIQVAGLVSAAQYRTTLRVGKRRVSLVGVRGLTGRPRYLSAVMLTVSERRLAPDDLRPRRAKPGSLDYQLCSGQANSFCSYRRSGLKLARMSAKAMRWRQPGSYARAPIRRCD